MLKLGTGTQPDLLLWRGGAVADRDPSTGAITHCVPRSEEVGT